MELELTLKQRGAAKHAQLKQQTVETAGADGQIRVRTAGGVVARAPKASSAKLKLSPQVGAIIHRAVGDVSADPLFISSERGGSRERGGKGR